MIARFGRLTPRVWLLAGLGLLTACCPDAREPRRVRANAGNGPGTVGEIVQLLEFLSKNPNLMADAMGGGRRARGGGGNDGWSAAVGNLGGTGSPAAAEIPAPDLTHEDLKQAIQDAEQAITPDSADAELERLREELEKHE